MPSSRAVRIAVRVPASLRYGLPGSTHTASKPRTAARSSASSVGTQ